ncbi:MAG: transcriptional regulator [Candidatus Portnoybacteria bacterium CG10_big_fil_rev_8_21_14_0_10_44_7]|uniref:Transcriptional regulator n=1 Tax=Candidatus Portnoybacteria bacterium CG10_big_fil_rev_8_21_14_0_10_44_7 TaxID=1974816 RepID=A0A2M8KI90_9BACT|nr:MAG: transcriptional regulator [Candidatus Portnoybacteria bacterium CG10_big_fil_rev_8_21_14_0_10_44_7]
MSINNLFQALSDQNRRKILQLLKKNELAAGQIADKLKITNATVSHHLDILKRADLVSAERRGQQIIYSLNLSVFEEAVEKILGYFKK